MKGRKSIMKKNLFSKILVASALAGLVSCNNTSSPSPTPTTPSEQTISGVASYESHGNKYGMAVKVTFDGSKKITKVERDAAKIEELKLVEITQTSVPNMWDHEAMQSMYDEKIGDALNKFVGLDANAYYTEAAAALQVNIDDKTTWPSNTGEFATKYFVLTGATQSSTRLSVAVANACATLLGKDSIVFTTNPVVPPVSSTTPSTPTSTPSTPASTPSSSTSSTEGETSSTPEVAE